MWRTLTLLRDWCRRRAHRSRIMPALQCQEVFRTFVRVIKVKPFIFEDFLLALQLPEASSLLNSASSLSCTCAWLCKQPTHSVATVLINAHTINTHAPWMTLDFPHMMAKMPTCT